MKPSAVKNYHEPIIAIKKLDDGKLVVIDKYSTIRFVERNTLKTVDGFKAKIEYKYYKNRVIDFATNKQYFASITSDAKETRLYSLVTKKAIAKIARHQGEVSCIGIDPKNRYLFSCGDDGKTFGMDMAHGKLALTLPHHPDRINDIAFNKTGQWVATCGFDRKVSIYNLDMMQPLGKPLGHSKPVMKVVFISKNRLVSLDKDASLFVWNLFDQSIITRLQGIHDDVTAIAVEPEGKFLFFGTNLGYIIVFDMEEYKIISQNYLKFSSSITSLFFDEEDNFLYIGTEDGHLYKYDIYDGVSAIKELIQKREFHDIEMYLKKNPILLYSEIYNILETIWEKTLQKARRLFENDKKEEALKLLSPYKEIPSKNTIIKNMQEQYKDFRKFYEFVVNGKYALAYSLAEQNPLYKESQLYNQLEEKWRKVFKEAQKLILDPRTLGQEKELLMPFQRVSEKAKAIQEMYVKGNIYNRFKVALGQNDLAQVYIYLEKYSFLKNFPEYQSMMEYAQKLYEKGMTYFRKNELIAALKYLKAVMEFKEYKDKVAMLVEYIDSRSKFFEAIKENELSKAYYYLGQNEELALTKEGKQLEQMWDSAVIKANRYAAKGDVLGVKNALEDFLDIKQKHPAIATIIAYAYRTQIENAIKSKQPMQTIEKGIKNYVAIFGKDEQIETLFKIFQQRYQDSKLNIDLLHEGSLNSWHPTMIVSSILE